MNLNGSRSLMGSVIICYPHYVLVCQNWNLAVNTTWESSLEQYKNEPDVQ